MAELQAQEGALRTQKFQLEAAIVENKLDRPDVAYVQGVWSRFIELWDEATEDERNELLPLLVKRVELIEKQRGFVRLSFASQNPRRFQNATSDNVLINSNLGAGKS